MSAFTMVGVAAPTQLASKYSMSRTKSLKGEFASPDPPSPQGKKKGEKKKTRICRDGVCKLRWQAGPAA